MAKKIKYFPAYEFQCDGVPCFDKMNIQFLEKLSIAREHAMTPFKITSSWRSKEYNDSLPNSSPNSAHLRGVAVDIACNNSPTRIAIIDALLTAGFTRIGVSKNFIHVDDDETLPQDVMWLY